MIAPRKFGRVYGIAHQKPEKLLTIDEPSSGLVFVPRCFRNDPNIFEQRAAVNITDDQ